MRQVQLVEEQLEVLSRATAESQDAKGKGADEEAVSLMPDVTPDVTPDVPSVPEEAAEMDCV